MGIQVRTQLWGTFFNLPQDKRNDKEKGESLDKGKNATQRFKRLRPEIRSLNVEI